MNTKNSNVKILIYYYIFNTLFNKELSDQSFPKNTWYFKKKITDVRNLLSFFLSSITSVKQEHFCLKILILDRVNFYREGRKLIHLFNVINWSLQNNSSFIYFLNFLLCISNIHCNFSEKRFFLVFFILKLIKYA